ILSLSLSLLLSQPLSRQLPHSLVLGRFLSTTFDAI
ncbi:MAG: hypothetical protein RJB38_2196, partial [Pseudomonadota bacterium]